MKISSCKEYKKSSAIAVENIEEVSNFLLENIKLISYNKELFSKKLGDSSFFCVVGSENRRFRIWTRELKSCTLIMLTHNVKGICLEYVSDCDNEQMVGSEIVEFLKTLLR